jgi:hypothetical protein
MTAQTDVLSFLSRVLTPIHFRSFSLQSSHLNFGLPTFLLPSIFLQNTDFHNIVFKIEHKLYIASGPAPSPPPKKRKTSECAYSLQCRIWLVPICQIIRRHILQDRNLRENRKPHSINCLSVQMYRVAKRDLRPAEGPVVPPGAAWCIPVQWRSDSCEIAHLVVTAEGIIAPRSEARDNRRVKTPTLSKEQKIGAADRWTDSRPWLAVPLITVHWCTSTLIHSGLSRTEYLVCYLMILYQIFSAVPVVHQAGCPS